MMTSIFTFGIRFEVAQDVLGALISHWAAEIAALSDAGNTDRELIARAMTELRKYRAVRAELNPRDPVQIEAVIAKHSALAKQFFASP